MVKLGLDEMTLARRKRLVRGMVRQAVRRPANARLWGDYQQMLEDSREAPALHQPGRFWSALQRDLARELVDESLDGFKRSINTRFSGFAPSEPLFFEYTLRNVRAQLLESDRFGLLETLDEPVLGNPYTVTIEGRRTSVDLLQSVSEFYAMTDGVSAVGDLSAILEVGSGYGRVADLVHRATQGGCCYCLSDLPLPLALAQNYLRSLWPDARMLAYGELHGRATLTARDLAGYDFVFLAPWQLPVLDEACCDIAVNINSFQEMTRAQVEWYLRQFERVSGDRIYLKEWFTFDNAADRVRISPADMRTSENWSRSWFRPSFPFPQWEEMLFVRV